MEYYYQEIDKLARYKINAVIWELEDKLRYTRRPEIGAPNAISKQEMQALCRYAKERNIEITPLVQGLGHAGFILKHHWELRENPDSSEVILYPEATLSYYFSDKEKGRMTTLKGKAFFQVKKMHGIPFRVKTDFLDVEVLGTSFLVDVAQKEKAEVFVKTGKVRVESAEHEVVIQANEKAELKGGILKADTILCPQDVFGVDDSVLIFEQAPIMEVVKVIREKTGIQIDLAEGLEKNLITTRINSNEPDIAGELAFLCGCKCETLVKGKHYRLYEK